MFWFYKYCECELKGLIVFVNRRILFIFLYNNGILEDIGFKDNK